jgi:hypothetical protein
VQLRRFLAAVGMTYDRHLGMAAEGQRILRLAPELLAQHVSSTIRIIGSGGKGIATLTPWVGFFDLDSGSTPEQGLYVVYLFAEDLKTVTLSLNQGVTTPSRALGPSAGRDKLRANAAAVRDELGNTALFGLRSSQSLRSHGQRQLAYEAGTIAALEYVLERLPSEPTLVRDLARFLDLCKISVNSRQNAPRGADHGPGRSFERAPDTNRAFPQTLGRLLQVAVVEISADRWEVLEERLSGATLAQIALARGVTRERIRQVEAHATRQFSTILAGAKTLTTAWDDLAARCAVSEATLLDPHLDSTLAPEDQMHFGQLLLSMRGFSRLRGFSRTDVPGWWTSDQSRFRARAATAADYAPMEVSDFSQWAETAGLPANLPWKQIFPGHAGPIVWDSTVEAWVHVRGSLRDAAYIALTRRGSPMDGREIAGAVGAKSTRNFEEQLRRDIRYSQMRPSGFWKLADWNLNESKYTSTLEAAVAVLRDEGPQTAAQWARAVAARYPVSYAAVNQCLAHEEIGRWPDGRIDLVERGAVHADDTEPDRPPEIVTAPDLRVILIYRDVDDELLRGSGLGVSRYLTWVLGLRRAPRSRVFEVPGYGEIEIRRLIHGSTISSLRRFASELGAQMGCRLAIRLDLEEHVAAVGLACENHGHSGRTVLGDIDAPPPNPDQETD